MAACLLHPEPLEIADSHQGRWMLQHLAQAHGLHPDRWRDNGELAVYDPHVSVAEFLDGLPKQQEASRDRARLLPLRRHIHGDQHSASDRRRPARHLAQHAQGTAARPRHPAAGRHRSPCAGPRAELGACPMIRRLMTRLHQALIWRVQWTRKERRDVTRWPHKLGSR